MALLDTRSFGPIQFQEEELVRFPFGLPGFEHETEFLPLDREDARPIIFLQSRHNPALFFLTLPVSAIDPEYELKLLPEHFEALGVAPGQAASLLCLAIVCMPDQGGPTANLLGPVVIDPASRTGIQAVRDDARYSALHPVFSGTPEGDGACS